MVKEPKKAISSAIAFGKNPILVVGGPVEKQEIIRALKTTVGRRIFLVPSIRNSEKIVLLRGSP